MRKSGAVCTALLFIMLCLSGCGAVGSKSMSLAWIYAAAAVVSLVLLVYHLKIRPHDPAELYVNRVAAEKAQKEAQENERTDP